MATASRPQATPTATVGPDRHPDVEFTPPGCWYDRSSITADARVTIEDQTEEDFDRYAPEDRFCEFIDGVVYMPSPVSLRHQRLIGFLFDLLNGFRLARDTGPILMGPAVLRVAPGRNLEPDLFVVPPGLEPLPPSNRAFGRADLVIEILSPGNRLRDLKRKAAIYREAGIPEVWYVDNRDKVLIAEVREGDGYRTGQYSNGILASAARPGFWIDITWPWADLLPNPRHGLDAILAGPPG